ncbi:MAG: dinuclear metal center YbgI/SA1388 family protein [Saprospiraceae bacterium]
MRQISKAFKNSNQHQARDSLIRLARILFSPLPSFVKRHIINKYFCKKHLSAIFTQNRRMKISEIISELEVLAPRAYAEGFDNTGLLIGDATTEVSGILVTLDSLESVVDEAIETNCNLIVSFHPIVFSGLKKITGKNYVERVVLKAIKNDIAIYAIHTALDNSFNGVNAGICDRLKLTNRKILIPQKGTIKKLITYAPLSEAEALRQVLFEAGAGSIGNYKECSFSLEGTGTYKGNEDSNPVVGKKHELTTAEETQINVTFPKHLESAVIKALHASHSYEEVAYEVLNLENTNQHIGMGMVGTLETPMEEAAFLTFLKKQMNAQVVRHSKFRNKTIKTVAVLGGSGAFAIDAAKGSGADVFITADLKYHDFYKAENELLMADIGHYESEQFTKELLHTFLSKKSSNFAPALPQGRVVLSKINTNPISYF